MSSYILKAKKWKTQYLDMGLNDWKNLEKIRENSVDKRKRLVIFFLSTPKNGEKFHVEKFFKKVVDNGK